MNAAARFLSVFEGSEVAHGQTTVGRTARNGKAEAKSLIIRDPLTEDLVSRHLSGGIGVGSIPINSKNMCRFAAIDVDDYDLDLTNVNQRVRAMNLPLVVCRSKSGGAHLYLFLKDWEKASVVREYMTEISSALGFAGREIFPKQDTVLHERGDVGNFINLPYQNAARSMRYALDDEGNALSLEDFLDLVDKKRSHLSDLEGILLRKQAQNHELKEYPPCVQRMVALGGLGMNRNESLMHTTTSIKKEFPDNWQPSVEEFNQRYVTPPLPAKEVVGIISSHEKKDYAHKCNVSPMKDYCDKEMCKQVKFGIGGGGGGFFPALTGLNIMLSDPRLYHVNVDGKRLELTVEELNSPREFQKRCLESLNMRPDVLKDREWGQIVNNLLSEATTVEVMPELTTRGEFLELLSEFCTSQVRAMAPEEVTVNKPWTNDGITCFKIQGLMDFLKRKDFKKLNRPQIQQILKDLHENPDDATGHLRIKKDDGTHTTVRVWRVPEFKSAGADISLGDEDDQTQIPF